MTQHHIPAGWSLQENTTYRSKSEVFDLFYKVYTTKGDKLTTH